MSYEKRKAERLRRKKIRNIIVLVIIGFFVIRSIPGLSTKSDAVVQPEELIIIDSEKVQGVLIQDEYVHNTEANIDESNTDMEGKKVPVGYIVGNINLHDNIADIKSELEEIEEAINLKGKSEEDIQFIEQNNKSIKSEQAGLGDSIQENIDEIRKVKELKSVAIKNRERVVDLKPDNRFLDIDYDTLMARKEGLNTEINKNTRNFATEYSGLISFQLDGFEEKLISRDWNDYNYEYLNGLKDMEESKNDKNGFKIIDNYYWYMALQIDEIAKIQDYEVDSLIRLEIGEKDKELVGKIIAINKKDDKAVVIVRLNNYLEEYYYERFPEVKIIKSKNDGFKIPNRSIIKRDDIEGVYIKEFNGIVRFRPIEKIRSDKENTFINKGNNGLIELKEGEEPVKTISVYDEILLNPKSFKDGEIID